jgi:hypothetical protein
MRIKPKIKEVQAEALTRGTDLNEFINRIDPDQNLDEEQVHTLIYKVITAYLKK